MAFLLPELGTKPKFLGVEDQPAPQSPAPAPIFRQPQSPSTSTSSGATKYSTTEKNLPTEPVSAPAKQVPQQLAAGGPSVGNTPQQQFTTAQAPKVAEPTPTDKPPGPKVVREAGESSVRRDATTGIAENRVDNTPENTVAKTYIGDDGSLHYTERNRDGSPKDPREDKEGWSKLSDEQKRALLEDYKVNLEEHVKSKPENDPYYYDPEEAAQMDDDGRLAGVTAVLEGTKPEEAAPKISVTASGTVTYPAKDAEGNLLKPWELEGWSELTPEQQSNARSHYYDAEERAAQEAASTPNPENNYAGLGISEADFRALPPELQREAMRTGKAPTYQVDSNGNVTTDRPEEQGGGTVTKDMQGNVVRETKPDGTSISYGANNTSVTTSPTGTITSIDSEGNETVKYVEGSEAEKAHKAEQAKIAEHTSMGFSPDGTQQLSTLDAWAAGMNETNPGSVDPANLTPKQKDAFEAFVAQSYIDNYDKGAVYAEAAIAMGLLTTEQWYQMQKARDYAHSFGAWYIRNADVRRAIDNSNYPLNWKIPTYKGFVRDRLFLKHKGYADTDDYFASMRNHGYIEPDAFISTDYTP